MCGQTTANQLKAVQSQLQTCSIEAVQLASSVSAAATIQHRTCTQLRAANFKLMPSRFAPTSTLRSAATYLAEDRVI